MVTSCIFLEYGVDVWPWLKIVYAEIFFYANIVALSAEQNGGKAFFYVRIFSKYTLFALWPFV